MVTTTRSGITEVVVDITREIDAEVSGNPYTVEVVLDELGGHDIYVSRPGQSADKLNYSHTLNSEIRETAELLIAEHGDAWFRQELQYEESRRRLVAAGAEDVD